VPASNFFTYLFHYFVARTLYSALGSAGLGFVLVVGLVVGVLAYVFGRKRVR
jgi:hypothetical protein